MAFTTNTVLRTIKPASSKLGTQGEMTMWIAPAKDTIAIKKGDVLIWDAGTLDIAADDAAADTLVGIAAYDCLGITSPDYALATVPPTPVRGSGGGICTYYPILPGMAFIGHVVADESGTGDETAIQGTIGSEVGVGNLSAGLFVFDQAASAKNAMVVDFALNQIDDGSAATRPITKQYRDQSQIISDGVRNPLCVVVFFGSAWFQLA